MKKKKPFIAGILLVLLITACSSGTDTATEEGIGFDGGYTDADMADEAENSAPSETESAENEDLIGEKVIRTANVTYETLDFPSTTNHVTETVANHEAYIEYSYETSYTPSGFSDSVNTGQQYRTIEYTFRVPAESLNAFLEDLEGMEAYKISQQIGTEDVTQSYRDIEARIAVLQNKEERLNTLLDQAETIEDILQIENNLSETIAERESLQSGLDNYDDLIAFSTVNVTVTERPRISNVRGENSSFWERTREAVANSFFTFYYWIQDVAIWLIYAVPYLLLLGLVVLLLLFIWKRVKRKRQK